MLITDWQFIKDLAQVVFVFWFLFWIYTLVAMVVITWFFEFVGWVEEKQEKKVKEREE